MTTRTQLSPGAMSAARVILRQVERLVNRPLADGGTVEGVAAIIDQHTNVPDLVAACEALLGDVDSLLQHSTDHLDNECQGGCEYCKHRLAARAAIAKAQA